MVDEPTVNSESTGDTVGNIAVAIFLGLCGAVVLLLLDRVFGGGWRTARSFFSTWLLLCLGGIPFGWYGSEECGPHKESWNRLLGQSAAFGAGFGLVYGLAVRSILPGVFFGGCIGHFVGFLLYFYGRDKASLPLPAAASAGAVLGVFMLCHFLGISTPTELTRADPKALSAAESPVVPAPPMKEPDPGAEKSLRVIAADDLLDMNPVAASKDLPGPFVVSGRIIKMTSGKSAWGAPLYEIGVAGDSKGDVKKGRTGYVDKWVECSFTDIAGLERVKKGWLVHIEGEYRDNLVGSVVRMSKCRLSPEHHTVK